MKICFPCLHSLVKTEANDWEISRADQWGHLLEGFQQAMEIRTTCFSSFIKLLFSVLTKRKTIYEACTVNSHNSETVNHIIFMLHSAMKTHLLTISKLFYSAICYITLPHVCYI